MPIAPPLRTPAPTHIEFRGLLVELNRCPLQLRQQLLCEPPYNPLLEIEQLEETAMAEAAAELSTTMLIAGCADVDIEDSLASLRNHLEEHFLQRKYVRLYER